MAYFTLVELDALFGKWCVAFGDYDRETVEDERDEFVSRGIKRKRLHVFRTKSDAQTEIDVAVKKLNGEF